MVDELKREFDQSVAIKKEKAKDMEDKYKDDPDPWKNGQRDLYTPIMDKIIQALLDKDIDISTWYDIGCGGGNVGKAFHNAAERRDMSIYMKGCDVSPSAIEYLRESNNMYSEDIVYSELECVDLETLTLEGAKKIFSGSKVVSMVEVIYYLGNIRPWKKSIDIIWESLDRGTSMVVADGLIPYQYRDYLKSKKDSETLIEYTDYDTILCTETSSKGTWKRFLKVRVYKKV